MTDVWRRINKTEEPLVATLVTLRANTKLLGEEKIRAVNDSFVHL